MASYRAHKCPGEQFDWGIFHRLHTNKPHVLYTIVFSGIFGVFSILLAISNRVTFMAQPGHMTIFKIQVLNRKNSFHMSMPICMPLNIE